MRFVLLEQIVSERAAGRIEYHRDPFGRLLLDHLVQHVEHAQDRAGRFPFRVAERRQRMEGSIQIRRAVDQDEFASAHGLKLKTPIRALRSRPVGCSLRRASWEYCLAPALLTR